MREDAATKARRYVTEGRLTIHEVSADRIAATCKGDGASYTLGWNPGDGWHCGCPASRRCCHVLGLRLVTVAKAGHG